jgi:hypothetical protein
MKKNLITSFFCLTITCTALGMEERTEIPLHTRIPSYQFSEGDYHAAARSDENLSKEEYLRLAHGTFVFNNLTIEQSGENVLNYLDLLLDTIALRVKEIDYFTSANPKLFKRKAEAYDAQIQAIRTLIYRLKEHGHSNLAAFKVDPTLEPSLKIKIKSFLNKMFDLYELIHNKLIDALQQYLLIRPLHLQKINKFAHINNWHEENIQYHLSCTFSKAKADCPLAPRFKRMRDYEQTSIWTKFQSVKEEK